MRKMIACAGFALLAGCSAGGVVHGPVLDLAGAPPTPETYRDEDAEHLRWVIAPDELDRYPSLDEAAREEMVQLRWAALDPTPTTPENERKTEHFRRLAFTREFFARERPPGWDERGELLLRYGVPDIREEFSADVMPGRGLVPPREVWVYHWLGQAYELQDAQFRGDFQDAFRRRESTRTDLQVDTMDLGTDTPDVAGQSNRAAQSGFVKSLDDLAADADEGPKVAWNRWGPIDAEKVMQRERLQRMVSQGRIALDEKQSAYAHDYGGEQLPFAFDVVNFDSPIPGRTRVEVHTAYRAEDLGYVERGAGWEATLEMQAAVKDTLYRMLDQTDEIFRHRRDSIDGLRNRLDLDQIHIDLEPGSYRLGLSVRDSVTARIGLFDTEIEVRRFQEGALEISDIQLAHSVSRVADGTDGPFRKGAYDVVPYPLSSLSQGQDIFIYFETVDLEPSPTGVRLYTIELLVQPRTVKTSSWFGSSRGRLIPGVSTSFDGISREERSQEYLALEPSTFEEGIYDFRISVFDRVSERRTSRMVSFAIREE